MAAWTVRSFAKIARGLALCGLLWVLAGLGTRLEARSGEAGRLLSFGSSARDVSLGGAAAAVPQGANSVYWNPALLSDVNLKDASFLQAQLFSQTSLNWGGYAHPFKRWAGTLGLQVMQLKTKDAEKRNSLNDTTGNFSDAEQVFGLGYGFHPTKNEHLSLGVGFNVLRRSLDSTENSLYGLDLGATYRPIHRLRSGFVLQNILRGRSGDTDDSLPLGMRFGNAYEVFNGFSLTGDLQLAGLTSPEFSFGTEYGWRFMSLRAGRPSDGDFAFGVGLFWKQMRLDIALSSHRDLGTSQIFSFGIQFGRDRTDTRRAQGEKYFEDAQADVARGRWLKARETLEKAGRSDPLSVPIHLTLTRLGRALEMMHFDPKRAVAEQEQKDFIGSGEPARLVREGIGSYVQGNDSDAALLLRQALAHRPDDKRLEGVVETIEKDAHLKPESERGTAPERIIVMKLKKVQVLFESRRYDEALKVCRDVVRLAPDLYLARVRLGSVYYAMGDMGKSRQEYLKARELNPDDESLRTFLRMQGWDRGNKEMGDDENKR